jgi:hypothetical protein
VGRSAAGRHRPRGLVEVVGFMLFGLLRFGLGSMADGCRWMVSSSGRPSGGGRVWAAMAPPSGWWMSGGVCQRQEQATTVVRKNEVDGGGEAERR